MEVHVSTVGLSCVVLSDEFLLAGKCAAVDSPDQRSDGKHEPVDSQDRINEANERTEPGNSHNPDSVKNGELKGSDSITGEPVKSEPQLDRDTLTSPSESTLLAVLEKLVRYYDLLPGLRVLCTQQGSGLGSPFKG